MDAVQRNNEKPRFGVGGASFQAAGGEVGIRRLVDDFYDQMDSLPEAKIIRAMHPTDLTVSRDKLARFLCGWLGGPKLFQQKYGSIIIPKAHSHLPIGRAERDTWLLCMSKAIEQQPYSPEFKKYLLEQLAIPAERCRTRE
ncbi:MAG: group II truncated hemoglobin [Deltaproteobacteria bacterium]|nr:group II truncated hemoglobin [Deltaproteobacteria bacterium]